MRSRHRIPDPGDGFLPFGHEVGGTTSAGSAYWERTAVASRHRDTVPAIFDDGAVSHKSTLRCALLNVRYAPIATKLRSAAKWRDVPIPDLAAAITWLSSRLTADAQRTKPSDLLVTHAASATMRPGRNCQEGGVREIRIGRREIRIGHAVGRAARCASLTLLVAGEPTVARASIIVALQAIPILASCDRDYASCEDGRRRREGGKKEGTHFSPTLKCPT
jgi:hypothetical protein